MTELIHSQEGFADIEMLDEIGSCMAAINSFHDVLNRIIDMVTVAVRCDSCFIYVLEKDQLVLRASKNPHADVVDKLGMNIGPRRLQSDSAPRKNVCGILGEDFLGQFDLLIDYRHILSSSNRGPV